MTTLLDTHALIWLAEGLAADRILIATARIRGFTLATRDSRILAYGRAGHVKVVAV